MKHLLDRNEELRAQNASLVEEMKENKEMLAALKVGAWASSRGLSIQDANCTQGRCLGIQGSVNTRRCWLHSR